MEVEPFLVSFSLGVRLLFPGMEATDSAEQEVCFPRMGAASVNV